MNEWMNYSNRHNCLHDFLYATLHTVVLRIYWALFGGPIFVPFLLLHLASLRSKKRRRRQDSNHLPPEIIQVHNPTGPRCPPVKTIFQFERPFLISFIFWVFCQNYIFKFKVQKCWASKQQPDGYFRFILNCKDLKHFWNKVFRFSFEFPFLSLFFFNFWLL